MKKLTLLVALLFVGCGSPKTTPPPSPKLPQMGGTWAGTIVLQGSTPNLKLVLTEDSAGNLSGTVSSTTSCSFSLPVTGAIYADYMFSVQASDPTVLLLAGSMANNNVDAQGSVNLGNGVGCGPASGAPFYLGKQ